MAEGKRKLLIALVFVGLIAIGMLQKVIDPIEHQINVKSGKAANNELMVQLPGQFILASVTGFKEVVAGLLWVRADTYFHSGDYEAIIPLVRLVTWLDPHNIDVYSTGAWHLDYNFVDSNELSDKRYLPASIALLKEGIKNNPNAWDLYFELGWVHYNRKLEDIDNALKYVKLACEKDGFDPNTGKVTDRPEFVDHMLAHMYEKAGQYDNAIKQWQYSRQRTIDLAKKNHVKCPDEQMLTICDRNLSLLYLRLAWRYGNMDYYKKGVELLKRMASEKDCPADTLVAVKEAEQDYKQRLAANNPPRDALNPIDAGFHVEFYRVKPRVFQIKGKLSLVKMDEYKNLASECVTHSYRNYLKTPADKREVWENSGIRVYWKLTDLDYKSQDAKSFSWKIDKSKIVQWDSVPVNNGAFKSEPIKFDQDRDFYPFKSEKYKLTVWVKPTQPGCADFIQDRLGWKGEGMTDKNYLDTKMFPGMRCLKWEAVLDKKDLM